MYNDEQARLKSIVETAADGIVTTDEKGNIESFNPAAERMFGYAAATMIGENVSRLMPQPYHEQHNDILHRPERTSRLTKRHDQSRKHKADKHGNKLAHRTRVHRPSCSRSGWP